MDIGEVRHDREPRKGEEDDCDARHPAGLVHSSSLSVYYKTAYAAVNNIATEMRSGRLDVRNGGVSNEITPAERGLFRKVLPRF